MKSILTLILLQIAFLQTNAQQTLLNFQEESQLINGVLVKVGNVHLNGDLKQVEKSWKKFIKSQLNEKVKEKDGVLIVKEIVINQITDKRGDLMAYIFKTETNSISLNVAYKLGYDVYLNSAKYKPEFDKMTAFINTFVYTYYNDYLPKLIKNKNKSLKTLNKEKATSEKSIKKLNASNKKNAKKTIKSEKQVAKMGKKLSKDEASKSKISIDQNKLKLKIDSLKTSTANNTLLINTQQSNLTSLTPKIDALTSEIASLQITLIEVKAKVRQTK